MYPWNVGKLHTGTQYLLRELGRGRLVRDSKSQGCAKRSQGIIKRNPLRMKSEVNSYTLTTVSLSIRIYM